MNTDQFGLELAMEPYLSIEIRGIVPVPQGNLVAGRFGGVHESNPQLRSWRDTLTDSIIRNNAGRAPLYGPIECSARFYFPYLKKHYGTGKRQGELKKDVPRMPITKPDLDKLQRSVGDALTDSRVIQDDSQIVSWVVTKWYADMAGVSITLTPVEIGSFNE